MKRRTVRAFERVMRTRWRRFYNRRERYDARQEIANQLAEEET